MPNDIKKLKRLMYAANHLKKENPVILKGQKITSSQALKYAWWFESFRAKLASGVYRFSYFKIDGGIREAKGTLNGVLIPAEDLPSSDCHPKHPTKESYSSVAFYDIDKKGWRAFNICRFIGFVTCYSVEKKERVIKESSKEN